MNRALQIFLIWLGIAVCIFATFRWLFGLALPEEALAFSFGTTVIIMGGLIVGRYVSKMWFNIDERSQNILLILLLVFILTSFIGVGILINKMIKNTEFLHFSFTVFLLFFISACACAFFSLIRNRISSKLRSIQSVMVHNKSELQLLQSQLSPHFLFNTLNNIYGLSLTDHSKVPALLLKLSDLLRYSVYETKELFVPLQREIDYLNNYIEFEKVRLGDRLELKTNLGTFQANEAKIAPMLLIVFVENAFKHSRNSAAEKIFVEISLQATPHSISFMVRNSASTRGSGSDLDLKHSGFGLESVRKRLALLYKGNHDLKIQESDASFLINLSLFKQNET